MNKEWSEQNKMMQVKLRRKDTYREGIDTILALREELMETLFQIKNELSREEFNAMPYLNAKGYHSKSIAYSIWHIFRIEDIVAHTLICDDEEIFFAGNYQERIQTPIVTTGNELVKQQIEDFSKQLDIEQLYIYAMEVKESTEKFLRKLSYEELNKRISLEHKEHLQELNVVSGDEEANWLIDYWCEKSVRGLIQMPFSRHWMMHIEASLRMKDKIMRH